MGKTVLVEDFLAEVEAGPYRPVIARGRSSERLAGSEAYLPVLEALEGLMHPQHGESFAELMRVTAPTWYFHVARLSPGRHVHRAAQGRRPQRLAGADQARAGGALPRDLPRPAAGRVLRRPALGRRLDDRSAQLPDRAVRRHAGAPARYATGRRRWPCSSIRSCRSAATCSRAACSTSCRSTSSAMRGRRALPRHRVPGSPAARRAGGAGPRAHRRQSAVHGRPAALPARPSRDRADRRRAGRWRGRSRRSSASCPSRCAA